MIKIRIETDQTLKGDFVENGTYKTIVSVFGVKLWEKSRSAKNDIKDGKKGGVGFG